MSDHTEKRKPSPPSIRYEDFPPEHWHLNGGDGNLDESQFIHVDGHSFQVFRYFDYAKEKWTCTPPIYIGETLYPSPPAIPEFLSLLFEATAREGVSGDREERFKKIARTDLRRAKRYYWADTLRSLWPLLYARLKKLGAVGILFEIGRRLLGRWW